MCCTCRPAPVGSCVLTNLTGDNSASIFLTRNKDKTGRFCWTQIIIENSQFITCLYPQDALLCLLIQSQHGKTKEQTHVSSLLKLGVLLIIPLLLESFKWARPWATCFAAWKENTFPVTLKLGIFPFHSWANWGWKSLRNLLNCGRWLKGKESACQCRRCEFNPWARKIPWRRK